MAATINGVPGTRTRAEYFCRSRFCLSKKVKYPDTLVSLKDLFTSSRGFRVFSLPVQLVVPFHIRVGMEEDITVLVIQIGVASFFPRHKSFV